MNICGIFTFLCSRPFPPNSGNPGGCPPCGVGNVDIPEYSILLFIVTAIVFTLHLKADKPNY